MTASGGRSRKCAVTRPIALPRRCSTSTRSCFHPEDSDNVRQVKWVIADLPLVECDPILVKQVFQNLLANALKFTSSRTPAVIEVSYKQDDR